MAVAHNDRSRVLFLLEFALRRRRGKRYARVEFRRRFLAKIFPFCGRYNIHTSDTIETTSTTQSAFTIEKSSHSPCLFSINSPPAQGVVRPTRSRRTTCYAMYDQNFIVLFWMLFLRYYFAVRSIGIRWMIIFKIIFVHVSHRVRKLFDWMFTLYYNRNYCAVVAGMFTKPIGTHFHRRRHGLGDRNTLTIFLPIRRHFMYI